MPKTERTKCSAKPVIKLYDYVPYQLSGLGERCSTLLSRKYVKEHDLTVPQWRVLFCLASDNKASVTSLAAITRFDKSRIGRAVERLIKRNLVNSVVDTEDKRAQILSLTDEGKVLFDKIATYAVGINERLLYSLNEEELRIFNRVLIKLDGAVNQLEREYKVSSEGV